MLSTWLTSDTIQIVDSIADWKQAIKLSAKPLLDGDFITPSYIESIYESHEKNGPYYVIAPGIAMPHARPEAGVNKLGLTMLLVKNGVNFNSQKNDPVRIITTLAAPNSNDHLEMLTALAGLFSESDEMQKIIEADSVEQILEIINKY